MTARDVHVQHSEERRQWHLDKTFSISHLISTIAGITVAAVLISRMDTRITLIEQTASAQKTIDTRQDSDIAESRRSIKEDLRDINAKIDRLIEKTVAK